MSPLVSSWSSLDPHCYKLVMSEAPSQHSLPSCSLGSEPWLGVRKGWAIVNALLCPHLSELLPIHSSTWEYWVLAEPSEQTEWGSWLPVGVTVE